tara:strand:+ start:663 stop:1193 length:531 start_codon:yes stop_codon:yes gene_type:complete
MAQIAYIQYKDVVKATKNSKKKTKNTETFYKSDEFIGIFEKIFGFKGKQDILITMLNNWDNNIREDIENCLSVERVIKKEIYEIKRLTLKEITTIINIGKYAIKKLNLIPEIALAFCLGVYYANFIFEQTSLSLTIKEIYDILPENIKKTNDYKKFVKLFIIKGTSNEIVDILFRK